MSTFRARSTAVVLAAAIALAGLVAAGVPADAKPRGSVYPLHTDIVATTFWVGEIFDPNAPDGSQMISTYDDDWYASYGGCDGVHVGGECRTERRTAANDYFPSSMTPRQNPFYLDLPYDDLNDAAGLRYRRKHVPWAKGMPWAVIAVNKNASIMKNRWVKISRKGRTCYGQIQDAGPGTYHNARYVFGSGDHRPASKRYNNAGMDVSPALNGCLRFSELDGQDDRVSWRFVDAVDVPAGPWTKIVTR